MSASLFALHEFTFLELLLGSRPFGLLFSDEALFLGIFRKLIKRNFLFVFLGRVLIGVPDMHFLQQVLVARFSSQPHNLLLEFQIPIRHLENHFFVGVLHNSGSKCCKIIETTLSVLLLLLAEGFFNEFSAYKFTSGPLLVFFGVVGAILFLSLVEGLSVDLFNGEVLCRLERVELFFNSL